MDLIVNANKLNVLDVDFLSISMEEAVGLIERVIADDDKQCVSFILSLIHI